MIMMKSLFRKKEASNLSSDTKQQNWYSEEYYRAVGHNKILSFFLLLSAIVILGLGISVNDIARKKTIEPFIVEVNEKSGIATYVHTTKDKLFSDNEAITNYFMHQYIKDVACYDKFSMDERIKKARLFSSSFVYRQYIHNMSTYNESSKVNLFSNAYKCSIKFISILPISKETIQVRFRTSYSFENGNGDSSHNKIALIKYHYTNLRLSEEDRTINPLGFEVTKYEETDELAN